MTDKPNLLRPDRNAGPPPEVPNHEVLKWIGGGSYGEVWLARNIMGVFRAVKVVRRARFENDKPYDREFEGLRNFEPVSRKDDGFMDILQVGRNDAEGYFFYVMEAADDEVTGQRIEPDSYKPKTLQSEFGANGRLPFASCIRIALSLADSLHHLHKHGLVHRDIKPSNIIFVNDIPKLADIGLVTSATSAATFIGAPGFIPPEGPGTPQGDVYALGKVLYEIVTGNDRSQFPKPPMDLADSDLNEFQELNEIILKACESDPRRRYGSAEKMHEDLVLLQGGKSVRRLRGLERKYKLTAYVAAGSLILALLLVGVEKMRSALREQANAQRREKLSQVLMTRRLTSHTAGWSTNAWLLAVEAARLRTKESSAEVRNQTAALLEGLDAHRVEPFTNYGASSVAFDHEGIRLLIGGHADTAKLWNGKTRELRKFAETNSGPLVFANDVPVQLRYDLDSRSLTLGELDGQRTLQEWRVPEQIGSIKVETNAPVSSTLTPNGDSVAAVLLLNNGGQAVVASHSNAFQLEEVLSSPSSALAISPDGSLVAVAQSNHRISVWSVRDERLIADLATDRNNVLCLAFKRTTRVLESRTNEVWLLAAGDSGGNVTLWDLDTRTSKAHYRGGHYGVSGVTFNPDGTILASGGRGPVKLWDMATERLLLDIPVGGSGEYLTGLDFTADGQRLAISMHGSQHTNHVTIWKLEFGRGIQTLRGLSSQISKVCFSADGQLMAALSHNWEVGIWNLRTGQLRWIFEVPAGEYADNAALAFDSRGERLVFAASEKAKMWNVESGAVLEQWPLSPGRADVLVFPDENHLLLGRMETSVYRIRNLLIPDSPVTEDSDFNEGFFNSEASQDGRFFVVEGKHRNSHGTNIVIKAYDGYTGKELWSRTSSRTKPGGITIATTGQFVAFQTNDSVAAVMVDMASGLPIRTLPWLPVAIGPTGGYYAVRSDQGLSVFKETNTISVVTLGIDGENSIHAAPIDRTGNQLAWGNKDGTVTVNNLTEIRNRLIPLGLAW